MFDFLKTQWIMKRIDKEYLNRMVLKERISELEKQDIINTQQI